MSYTQSEYYIESTAHEVDDHDADHVSLDPQGGTTHSLITNAF
jgi:hypothetical protein